MFIYFDAFFAENLNKNEKGLFDCCRKVYSKASLLHSAAPTSFPHC